jgi:hypothetical protein
VCGVEGRVSANLPLEGENDDDRKNHEAEREPRRLRRGCNERSRRTSHRDLRVPTTLRLVKVFTILLEAMTEMARIEIKTAGLGASAIALLILPR